MSGSRQWAMTAEPVAFLRGLTGMVKGCEGSLRSATQGRTAYFGSLLEVRHGHLAEHLEVGWRQ